MNYVDEQERRSYTARVIWERVADYKCLWNLPQQLAAKIMSQSPYPSKDECKCVKCTDARAAALGLSFAVGKGCATLLCIADEAAFEAGVADRLAEKAARKRKLVESDRVTAELEDAAHWERQARLAESNRDAIGAMETAGHERDDPDAGMFRTWKCHKECQLCQLRRKRRCMR